MINFLDTADMQLITNVLWRARHQTRMNNDDEGVQRADVAISLMRQASLRNAQIAAEIDGAAAAGRVSVDEQLAEQREVHAQRALQTEPPLSTIYEAAERELRPSLPAAAARRSLPPKRAAAKRRVRPVKAETPAMARLVGANAFDISAGTRFISALSNRRAPLEGAKPARPMIPVDLQEELKRDGALTSPELSGALLAYAKAMPNKPKAAAPANRSLKRMLQRAAVVGLVILAAPLGAALAAAL